MVWVGVPQSVSDAACLQHFSSWPVVACVIRVLLHVSSFKLSSFKQHCRSPMIARSQR